MPSSTMQMFAFILAVLGVVSATVATLLPNWKVSADVGSNIMTAISQMQGLWMDCTWYSTGVFSCSLKYSVLALPAYLQTARTTMVLSCMMATMGLCLAALGLKCTRWGGSYRSKGHTAISAGACFVIAGVLCLVPASWFTNEVITTFMDSKVPKSSKYEPGAAVYVAFVSAGFLLAAGVIFCLSCPGRRGGPLDSGSSHPDKPKQQKQRQEQPTHDQRKQQHREQQSQTESPEQEQSHRENLHQEKLQANDRQQEKSVPDRLNLEKDKQYYSPSRTRNQDAKAVYSLHDYSCFLTVSGGDGSVQMNPLEGVTDCPKREHLCLLRRCLQLVFNYASKKTECSGISDAMLRTTVQQRKWRQKKPQRPPVLAGSEKVDCGDILKCSTEYP
ncbi:hypothetical protein Q8A67_017342 [Cirrhinus molitorella]|uniref:Claudin n=1 Tax=Cirrhinus molitorella TaxID=172907 RepID=A0AA88TJV2_9TELE|nr:hypothetical protein Q8A67_017342 [Cirrhinus molitorella]